ncbi:hypothetical protein SAMN02745221_00382 [Thermosyntropha lipolytica DSM 11003]|uniref:Uncharacterized protein n=1 Tax=Thermosyntropha lipolytica DSM 11003 TaxID=1123382 RepID=A0A1M5KHI9_9FIRM|nr:hypothetical protein [Thermosyntropha lipolytica]SHG52231.1 hypothetical protein SAMN02745221_00382 [Thermosyntropha lipolytica DSM 11003]
MLKEEKKARITNCYRALLAQVNYLDSIYADKKDVKDLYEELSILAFYIMQEDYERIVKSIKEIKDLSQEIAELGVKNTDKTSDLNLILEEIKTHLDYVLLQYA